MSNSWGTVPESPRRAPQRRGPVIAAVVVVVVIVAAAAVGGWFFLRGNGDDGNDGTAAAGPGFTSVPVTTSEAAESSDAETPEEVVETVTVTAEPEPDDTADGDHGTGARPDSSGTSPRDRSGGALRCDGRGVLVVESVMGNSPTFDNEVDSALAANPGSVVVAPGTCASLRSSVDGAEVYAVVVDYGSDVSSLCSAEAAGGGYSRVLDNTASYRSPC